jgi:hypothetical protein
MLKVLIEYVQITIWKENICSNKINSIEQTNSWIFGSHERNFSITVITWSRSIPGLFDDVRKCVSGKDKNDPFKHASVLNNRDNFLKESIHLLLSSE